MADDLSYADRFPVLFASRTTARGLDEAITATDLERLCAEYAGLRASAPSRTAAGKRYFVDGHDGVPSTTKASNRAEEHLAIALWFLGQRWPLQDGETFRLLDYQVPLKARQGDAKVGKVDLFGVADDGRAVIVELKHSAAGKRTADTPLGALLEGLRYGAILEANMAGLAFEAEHRFGLVIEQEPPRIVLMAHEGWWRSWAELRAAGAWREPFSRLLGGIRDRLGIQVDCLSLGSVRVIMGGNGSPPVLMQGPEPRTVVF